MSKPWHITATVRVRRVRFDDDRHERMLAWRDRLLAGAAQPAPPASAPQPVHTPRVSA